MPTELTFPDTMTDIDHSTWMLSGSSVMQDGCTICSDYPCDLDRVKIGSIVGVIRCSDGTLHFYLDGEDKGVAAASVPEGK